MHDMHPIAAKLAVNLSDAEQQSDTSILESAALITAIVEGRRAANLPFGAAQGAMADAGEAITLQLRARHHLCRAHERLLATASHHGLVTAHGDVMPTFSEARDGAPELRIVA